MSQWTGYWKIVQPQSRKQSYSQPTVTLDDSTNMNSAGYGALSSNTWFTNLLKGATSRMQRYKQYDAMDHGDINRALDIIAEELAAPDKKTGLPFIIEYLTEENQEIPESITTTLRAALRHWSTLHNLHRQNFNISRIMVKYGDCIFRKYSDTKRWEYIDLTRVMGIEVDAVGAPVNYHIRPSSFQNNFANAQQGQKTESLEIVPAVAIVHFTLSDSMSETAPFGMSLLQAAFRDYQKLSMLEDTAIIFRLVRAPSRRVFYIDTGNMPPHRVKQQLETVKNDLQQKRMPNTANSNQTDSTYSAESITQDFYLAVNAAGRGSRIEQLESSTTWDMPELDYFQNKVFRSLRVPSSYMKGQDSAVQGAQWTDGKVGVAYMEERIFAQFVQRLQACVDTVFDEQFKIYLQVAGINIDLTSFKLTLPEPQNFALYRQAGLDTDLINSFKAISDTPYLSPRFMLSRYLGLTKDEILMNELMKKEELGIAKGSTIGELQQLYDPAVYENREAITVGSTPPEEAPIETPEQPEGEGEEPETADDLKDLPPEQ